ncbi:OmpP1/FadL family transporter [Halodesulfovibrio marinisediminis]|uniref:Long-chain fatty acid transport protein n=1 Tax=Halodesulfovibrio marinisediminis DSM 17456 TaxID=1121457 RepID=A0A1N6DF07_9BACT|nr:OmpP1/FadL family transporter [Halodesulfovibrio marinisediminis]SIN69368.1 long-chain fatty acid transport protein [Halodesulfovibrio marinisediminis DSM 17456]
MKRHFLSIVASCVLLLAVSTSASAAGFALYEWSARGNALGGTLVGRADDPSAVAYNPAGLTQLEGTHLAVGSSFASPIAEVETTDGSGATTTAKSNDALFPIPHFYVTHKINDKWAVGFGEYSRFGLGFGFDDDWAGRYNVYDAKIISLSLNPNIAYKITDRLSAAVGIEYVYVDVAIKKAYPTGGRSKLTGSGDGVAVTAGLHYKLDKWRFGVGYHSQAKVDATGDTDISGSTPTMGYLPDGEYDTDASIVLPDMISFGITYYPIEELSIELAAVNTRWSTYRNFDLTLDTPYGDKPVFQEKDWNDVWRFSLGAEYDINENWTVRGSYTYDEAPENSRYVDYMIPAADRHLIGAGVGYKIDNWTIDLAYTYIIAESVNYDHSEAPGTSDGKSKNGVTHIGAVTVGYAF